MPSFFRVAPVAPLLVACALLVGCAKTTVAPAAPTTTTPTPTTPTTQQVIGVSGTHFTLNGSPWLPKGVVMRGFVATPAFLQQSLPLTYKARLNFGQAELDAAHTFGADVLRFQVSQPSLDPQSTIYSAQYVQDVIAAIKLARQNNFVVDISMQDETQSGDPAPYALATAATVRDWDMLSAQFGTDRGIIFELYNEPRIRATAAGWQRWANGDPAGTPAPAAVGMQTLVTHLRAGGSQNVFLADGLELATTLAGVPLLTDPLGRVVYAVHPYLHGSADESQWDAQFGQFSQSQPVYCSEWSAGVGSHLGLGQLPSYQPAVDLVNYLRTHGIGLGAGAFDVNNVIAQGPPTWLPNTYANYVPGDSTSGHGAGQLIHTAFTTNYARPLTPADGL